MCSSSSSRSDDKIRVQSASLDPQLRGNHSPLLPLPQDSFPGLCPSTVRPFHLHHRFPRVYKGGIRYEHYLDSQGSLHRFFLKPPSLVKTSKAEVLQLPSFRKLS